MDDKKAVLDSLKLIKTQLEERMSLLIDLISRFSQDIEEIKHSVNVFEEQIKELEND